MFYRKCGDIASCNCAVAARAGDDVIVIDKCGPSAQNTLGFYPLTVRLFRNGVLTPGFKLLSRFEGREHKVCLTLHCKFLLWYTGSSVCLGSDIKIVLINSVPLSPVRVVYAATYYIFYHPLSFFCRKKNKLVILPSFSVPIFDPWCIKH